jgi:hypothetical protein
MQTAYTTEIDDIGDALSEIFGQIDLDGLGKNSIGLLYSCYDFIETGVVRALCERLPFDVIGMTTMASASGGNSGMYRLCLTILTSDEVSFEPAVTSRLSRDNYEREIDAAYRKAREKLPGDPAFIISYFPFIGDLSAADLLKSFDKTCEGISIWGSVASGMDMSYEHCRTLWNGEADKQVLAMLLVHGPIEPQFIVTSIPEKNIRDSYAIITESEGCTLKKVNDMKFDEYIESMGLVLRIGQDATTIPLMVNYGDDSKPVALAIYGTDEEGGVVCGGEMPEGASFAIGQIDYDGIIETAKTSIEQALRCGKKNGLLMLPCVTRYIMLSPQQDDEFNLVAQMVGGQIPYAMGYSGGEVCPVPDKAGKYHNRHHNYTFSLCVF